MRIVESHMKRSIKNRLNTYNDGLNNHFHSILLFLSYIWWFEFKQSQRKHYKYSKVNISLFVRLYYTDWTNLREHYIYRSSNYIFR